MVLRIGEVAVEEAPPETRPREAPRERPRAPDMHRIRIELRREADRLRRLWTD